MAERYSDEELLARHQAGESDAFNEIVNRYSAEASTDFWLALPET